MANNSNTKIVNGYTFKVVDGKVIPDLKANLKGVKNLTTTTKKVAMAISNHEVEDSFGAGL